MNSVDGNRRSEITSNDPPQDANDLQPSDSATDENGISTDEWKHKMRKMLGVFQRQEKISLEKIIVCLECSGESFDAEFRKMFLKTATDT